ncbi:transglycosylase family protein [Streptomyces hirsutus]
MYTVLHGDTLSGIAEEERVRGGWRGLYDANSATVGTDPDLILPGQRLTLPGGKTTQVRPAPKPADTASKDNKNKKPENKKPEKKAPENKKPEKKAPEKKAPEKKAPSQRTEERADRTIQKSGTRVAPVAAPLGTPYHKAGSSWSKGYHTGVDFPVPTGTSVKAVAPGAVVSAGWEGSFGYQVVVRHADGRYSQYAHLSAISVKSGQSVTAGQRIGRSGSTGNSSGPHLHFEVRTGPGFGSDVDPVAYLRAGGVRM